MEAIHHIGIAVESIEDSITYYTDFLGMQQETDIILDEIQKVRVVLLQPNKDSTNSTRIELIEEAGTPSPITKILKSNNRMYHFCLEVESIDDKLETAREHGSIIIQKPVPAKLFDGRKIAFIFTPDRYIIEILQK